MEALPRFLHQPAVCRLSICSSQDVKQFFLRFMTVLERVLPSSDPVVMTTTKQKNTHPNPPLCCCFLTPPPPPPPPHPPPPPPRTTAPSQEMTDLPRALFTCPILLPCTAEFPLPTRRIRKSDIFLLTFSRHGLADICPDRRRRPSFYQSARFFSFGIPPPIPVEQVSSLSSFTPLFFLEP